MGWGNRRPAAAFASVLKNADLKCCPSDGFKIEARVLTVYRVVSAQSTAILAHDLRFRQRLTLPESPRTLSESPRRVARDAARRPRIPH